MVRAVLKARVILRAVLMVHKTDNQKFTMEFLTLVKQFGEGFC